MSGQRGKSTRFTRKMALAVSAVLNAPTLEDASQLIGIPTSTLRRWRGRPEFAQALAVAQAEIFSCVCNEVRQIGTDATKALAEIVRSTTAPAAARTRAASVVISLLLRIHTLADQESRLAAVERRLDAAAQAQRKESR